MTQLYDEGRRSHADHRVGLYPLFLFNFSVYNIFGHFITWYTFVIAIPFRTGSSGDDDDKPQGDYNLVTSRHLSKQLGRWMDVRRDLYLFFLFLACMAIH